MTFVLQDATYHIFKKYLTFKFKVKSLLSFRLAYKMKNEKQNNPRLVAGSPRGNQTHFVEALFR